MGNRRFGKGFENYTPEEQSRIALGREVASEGMVLLENDGTLPLGTREAASLFGVGQIGFLHGGSGSGSTFADYVVKLPEAMENAGAVINKALGGHSMRNTVPRHRKRWRRSHPICVGVQFRRWFSPMR